MVVESPNFHDTNRLEIGISFRTSETGRLPGGLRYLRCQTEKRLIEQSSKSLVTFQKTSVEILVGYTP